MEDELYKVERHQLVEHSEFFRAMFSLPSGDDAAEGSSDEKPICMPSVVTKKEFEALLRFLYPASVSFSLLGNATDILIGMVQIVN